MAIGIMQEQNLERRIQKQMGCMAGLLLQVFHRPLFHTGKRFSSVRRLHDSPAVGSTSESDTSTAPAPANSTGSENPAPAVAVSKQALPVPKFQLEEGSGKTRKEAARLSLDSRTTTDVKWSLQHKDTAAADGGHQSPGVIARLMGLEPLPSQPELRRSASESRVSKDLIQSRLIDVLKMRAHVPMKAHHPDPDFISNSEANEGSNRPTPPCRRNFFDTGDVFPARPKHNITKHTVVKRMKKGGIKEPAQDMETLKQIIQTEQYNFVRHKAPIVLLTKQQLPTSVNVSPENGRTRDRRRNVDTPPSVSPLKKRNTQSPNRVGLPAKQSISPPKPKPSILDIGTRRTEEPPETCRASMLHFPKHKSRRSENDQTVSNRLHSSKKSTHHKLAAADAVVLGDESPSISGSNNNTTAATTTSTDPEMTKSEVYRDGKCDQLLHTISDFAATDTQPSPVSVLNSSFYKDESLTPSPVAVKPNIDSQDQTFQMEEEIWSPINCPKPSMETSSVDSDFVYILDIVRAIHYLPKDSDIFLVLEKHQSLNGNDTYKADKIHRRLVFDIIKEIIERRKRLCNNDYAEMPFLGSIWSEFERIRGYDDDVIDLGELTGELWADCTGNNTLEVVVDVERLIFKDLICDSIEDLEVLGSRGGLCTIGAKKKLVF